MLGGDWRNMVMYGILLIPTITKRKMQVNTIGAYLQT